MLYSIIGYYNTGFNTSNIPYSSSVLKLAQQKTFPSNWLFQNRELTKTRINSSWDEIEDIDYVSIGDAYYMVTNIEMLTEITAELTLLQDGVTSVGGVGSLDITDGWCERSHTNNDTLFDNNIQEPFQPSTDLVIDGTAYYSDKYSSSGVTLVGATIDLSNIEQLADSYTDTSGNVVCYVPSVPLPTTESTVVMNLPTQGKKTAKIPNMSLYDFSNEKIQDGVRSARSLGLDTAITASYYVPEGWIDGAYEGGIDEPITDLTGVLDEFTLSGVPYKYTVSNYTVKNNKVYSLYNNYKMMGVCTGEAVAFDAHEIYSPDSETAPKYQVYADLSPDGKPFCQFKHYNRAEQYPFQNCVQGATWLNTPIAFGNASGSTIQQTEFAQSQTMAAMRNEISSYTGSIGSILKLDLGGMISGAADRALTQADQYIKETQFNTQQSIRVPDVVFPQSVSVQNYIGNAFMIIRTRLSDTDVERADKFLTMFGYAQSKQLEASDFTSRQYFNYVKASNVGVKGNYGLRLRNVVTAQLNGGVRVWHTLPNNTYYNNNPIG